MRALDQRVRTNPDVVDTELGDDEMALFHLETSTYFSLNVTGRMIWLGLKNGLTLEEVSRKLQEEFDVNEENANRSVQELVSDLSRQNLILT